MTAINVIRQHSAVHVLADGVATDGSGVVKFIAPKIWSLPNVCAAVVCRGPKLFSLMMADYLGGIATSYAELKAQIIPKAMRLCAEQENLLALCEQGPNFDLVVAGMSSQGPDSFVMCNHDRYGPAWSLIKLSDCAVMPGDEEILAEWRATLPVNATADDLNVERDGLSLMKIQRRHSVPTGDMGVVMSSGGFVQLMTITRELISTKIIHRWPDKVGEKVTA